MTLDGPSATERGTLGALLVLAATVQVIFVRMTGWTLEDAMILARVARTFVETGMLTFHPDAVVSTATSPPFALLVGWVASAGIDPLTAARCLGGSATLVIGGVLFVVARRTVGAGAWFAPAIYLLLPTTVAYATCGLETSLYALAAISALAFAYAERPGRATVAATAATLLRPDGVLVLAVVGGVRVWDLLRERRDDRRSIERAAWRRLARDGMLTAAVLLMAVWLHFRVYGTWVPWSVVAKGQAYAVDPWSNLFNYAERMLWSQKAGLGVYALAVVGAGIAWRRDRRLALFAAWYLVYHLAFGLRAPLFSWYLQPPIPVLALFAGLAVAAAIEQIATRLGMSSNRLRLVAGVALVAAALLLTARYARGRVVDATYERTVRAAAGAWLDEHAEPDALVFTESLGHVGYPNHNRFVDWPGLVSREVPPLVAGLSQIDGYQRIIEHFEPDLLVLRVAEIEDLGDALVAYDEVARFDSPLRGPGYRILQKGRLAGRP